MKRRGNRNIFYLFYSEITPSFLGAAVELASREELSVLTSSERSVPEVSTSSLREPPPTEVPTSSSSVSLAVSREDALMPANEATEDLMVEEEDSTIRNAERARRLLPTSIVERGMQHTQEMENRNQCLILTFGDYSKGTWQSGLTYLFRQVLFSFHLNFKSYFECFRLNWSNGDYKWIRNNYGAKYWPENSQLPAVLRVNSEITEFPASLIRV